MLEFLILAWQFAIVLVVYTMRRRVKRLEMMEGWLEVRAVSSSELLIEHERRLNKLESE